MYIHTYIVCMLIHAIGAGGVWVPNRNAFYSEALAEYKIERQRVTVCDSFPNVFVAFCDTP